jgi:hypothetical protein
MIAESSRPRRVVRPGVESLEGRAVPAGSITAMFGSLTAPVIAVKLPQPGSDGVQRVTFTLGSSADIPALSHDALLGKVLKAVTITLTDVGNRVTDTILLSNAVIASFQAVGGAEARPTYLVTVDAKVATAAAITATFDGQSARVIDVTLTQPRADGALQIGLTLDSSAIIHTLFQDAVIGRHVAVQIALVKDGNALTDTIAPTDALIASFVANPGGDVPTYDVTIDAVFIP